ncbi:tenascin-r [Plakobranchus ocellatus]|uniref:Tenascin-r n=1 Tax=Plakobranchus ocellatus TaxID=259542 RepID=A0AAV3YRM2_9GAST|nr:tenascin-r [Plakobranchus ocellatus]
MGILIWCAIACLFLGCQGLKLTLEPASIQGGDTCGILTCVENNTKVSTSQIPSQGQHNLAAIEVFKVDSNRDISDDKRHTLLASITSQQLLLSRDSSDIKIDGRLKHGQAILRLQLLKQEYCRSDFVCQARAVDSNGNEVLSTSYIHQKRLSDNEQGKGVSLTEDFNSGMQVKALAEKLDTALEVLEDSVQKLGSDIARLESSNKKNMKTMSTGLNAISDRIEDKIDLLFEEQSQWLQNPEHKKNKKLVSSVVKGYKYRKPKRIVRGKKENSKFTINDNTLLKDAAIIDGSNNKLGSLESDDLPTHKKCYRGMTAENKAKSYTVIIPDSEAKSDFPILCDTVTDGGGWIVIQRRLTGETSFNRGWEDYKTGFGFLNGDFWLGNDKVHYLTYDGKYELRITFSFKGNSLFAHYDSFYLEDEESQYVLHVGKYNGTAPDHITDMHNGRAFTTYDKDNDYSLFGNCAKTYKGGWWFGSCIDGYLNGLWTGGIWWGPLFKLTYTEMKIRPAINN